MTNFIRDLASKNSPLWRVLNQATLVILVGAAGAISCASGGVLKGSETLVAAQTAHERVEPGPVDEKTALEEQTTGDSDVQAPVVTEEPVPEIHLNEGTAWTPPDYSNQESALGYRADDFRIIPGLKERVRFWTDIYSKYTSSQGVIHDAENINLIYEVVDFSYITNDPNLSDREKYRARKKLVEQKKKQITEQLKRIAKTKSPEELSADDARVYKLFENVKGGNKFMAATARNRMRFQLGQRDFFVKGIYYSGRYLKQMEKIFREEGVPVELTRLPFVESSFNIYARSKVGASGIWQFMRGTGRQYMKVGYLVDERNDPLIATRAAARMLRQNYQLLESWPLAITAYNHGPSGVARIAKQCNSKDICEIIERGESRRFGFASKNFYASFIAAVEVEGHAGQYFGSVFRAPEIQFETAQLIKAMNFNALVSVFGGDREMTELFNSHFTQSVRNGYVPMPKGSVVRVPLKKMDTLIQAMNAAPDRAPVSISDRETVYKIVSGDTLSGISTMFGVPIRRIIEMNDVDPRRLRPGQKLVIPVAKD
ncbi:MAG TPA: transglycosylase SLT domain-containing protein [Bdellovibrionales bacterium]|nr:transglycosylase SLT domain-containing protein [Bdellovibrionales bacterium]